MKKTVLLSNGLMKTLKERNNTIINVTNFYNVLANIWNETHDEKITGYKVGLLHSDYISYLIGEYKNRLEKLLNKKINLSLITATDYYEVDCIRIEIVGDLKNGCN